MQHKNLKQQTETNEEAKFHKPLEQQSETTDISFILIVSNIIRAQTTHQSDSWKNKKYVIVKRKLEKKADCIFTAESG